MQVVFQNDKDDRIILGPLPQHLSQQFGECINKKKLYQLKELPFLQNQIQIQQKLEELVNRGWIAMPPPTRTRKPKNNMNYCVYH